MINYDDTAHGYLIPSIRNSPNMRGISSFTMKDYFKRDFWRALEKQWVHAKEVNA